MKSPKLSRQRFPTTEDNNRMKLTTTPSRAYSFLAWLIMVLVMGASGPFAFAASQDFYTSGIMEKRSNGAFDATTAFWTTLQNSVNSSSLSATAKANAKALINTASASFTTPVIIPNPKSYAGTNCSLSIYTERYPDYVVSAGHLATWAYSVDITLSVTDAETPPKNLTLKVQNHAPTAGISPASSTIAMGESVTLSLSKSNAAASGNSFSGPGVSQADPGSSVTVTPSSYGTSTYTYTVQGYADLSWTSDTSTGTFTLTTPTGSFTVGANGSVPVYVNGSYTITQTNSAGSASDSKTTAFSSTTATATVFVKAATPAPVISSFSGSVPSPSASISASPSSGTAPLSTTVSWSTSNAGSFSVTKNGSAWASSGSSKTDSSLASGSYTYQITAQPASYVGSLSWSATNATSYSISGPSSASISGTTATVTAAGTYTLTATGAGGSTTATFTLPSVSPISSSTSVTVSGGAPVISFFSGSAGPSPSVSIAASPASGNAPLDTMISWTVANASSFSVTKNGSAWASSGSSKSDSGLVAGSYTYQITAQPLPYSGSLSWSATNATSYSISGPSSASISGTTATVTAAGTYTLTATGPNGTTTATFTLPSISAASRSVAVTSITPTPPTVSISASPASGTAPLSSVITWSSTNATSVSVSGNSLSSSALNGSGSVTLLAGTYVYTITASGPGGSASASTTVTANAATYTITTSVVGPGSVTPGGTYPRNTGITVSETPNAGARFTGFSGDTGYAPGDPRLLSSSILVVLNSDKNIVATFAAMLPQTITFPDIGVHDLSEKQVTLAATASSGLPVTYTIVSGPGTIAGNVLTFTSNGTIVVQADQAGDATYLPAPPVQSNARVAGSAHVTATVGEQSMKIKKGAKDENRSVNIHATP
jgi:hypothetical protein